MRIKGIYFIKNKINGKLYIGHSVNIKLRFAQHKSSLRYNKHENVKLQRAWNKYGIENFEFGILEEMKFPDNYNTVTCSEYLESLEYYYIKLNNSAEQGYNIRVDSEPPYHSYFREKSSEKGQVSIRKKGYKRGFMSDEHKEKISIAIKTYKSIHPQGATHKKTVYQFTLDGEFIKEWEHVEICAKSLGLSKHSMRSHLYGKLRKCGSWIFSYSKESLLKNI